MGDPQLPWRRGYLRLAKETLDATELLLDGIRETSHLRILGEPAMSVFAFTSDTIGLFRVSGG